MSRHYLTPPEKLWRRVSTSYPLNIIVGILLGVGLLVLIIFLQQQRQPVSWRLADYSPRSTWVYIEFGSSEAFLDLAEKQSRLTRELDRAMRDLGLTQELVDSVAELSLVGLVNDKQDLGWAWLVRTPNPRQLEFILPQKSFFRQLGQEVAVWSMQAETIRVFRDSRPHKRSFKRVSNENVIWSGFLNPVELMRGFSRARENLLERTFFFWFGKMSEAGWTVSLAEGQVAVRVENLVSASGRKREPGRMIPGVDLLISGANLGKSVAALEDIMSKALPLHMHLWQKSLARFELDYQATHDELVSIFDRAASVQVRLSDEADQDLQEEFLALLARGKLFFVADFEGFFAKPQQEILRNLGKEIVAREVPSEVNKSLPDGTRVTHLVAEPEKLSYELFDGFENSAYLPVPELGQDVIFVDSDGRSIISNASSTLRDYLDKARHLDLPSCGDAADDGELAYVSSKILKTVKLLQDFQSAVIKLNGSDLNICFDF